MKTLSQLIQESLGRLEEEIIARYGLVGSAKPLKELLKTELETIVKESFKNTRVERQDYDQRDSWKDSEGGTNWRVNPMSNSEVSAFNQALSDNQELENQFLNN